MTTWVLLRGLGRESRHWGDFPQRLQQRLPAADSVAALDLPGNGGLWPETSPARVEDLVQAARRELAQTPHRPPYVLVAMSLGGMVALQWARLERRKVRACVLVNSSLGGLSPPWERLRPGALLGLLGLLLPGRTALARETRILQLTSNLQPPAALAPAWAAYAESCPVSRVNVLRQLWAAARFRAPSHGPEVPTLLLASALDRLVSPACSRAMAAAWDLPLREHPAAGHDLPLDDPDWVVAQVTGWHQRLYP